MYDHSRAYVRDALTHYTITMYNDTMVRMDLGWDTDGLLMLWLPWNHYFANFWWAKAKITANNIDVTEAVWHWRYGAERWVLSSGRTCRTHRHGFGSHMLWRNYMDDKPAKSLEPFMIDPKLLTKKPVCKPGE